MRDSLNFLYLLSKKCKCKNKMIGLMRIIVQNSADKWLEYGKLYKEYFSYNLEYHIYEHESFFEILKIRDELHFQF